ncbi:MAG: translocase FtsK protein [Candidatus Giovannonibacteria bacterium GW2011_GWC2_44_9]|uniref:Translocase FtsK protein n=3 Tax=Candidatus Giovannoniibacteriota TaxID=1752738 RepID=A0A0G1IYY0_9BACT|nr:MAG: translocase FtsK protein [Candidatus Giovannonibacteria bacterium GW2011_GWB1_44_23]KKT64198.1 MAG: translocase FtsK protein [Candidatus Giovannonibacteria bacterium GW2011_GWA1_44_29]KKT84435.1 MAG: translocase FtsK protein [Candidatus Giovannonibacteria bacterium GW2011_GWC2_44_9]KKT91799.1 MAG: translocase FtsK protein [Parcubacteria group bacterium GW2011_GWC1_45_13]
MAKKKRNNGKSGAGIGAWHQNLRPETKHSLWAVLSFLAAVLLALAYFGKAGLVGDAIQKTLLLVFGKGFFLVSLAFLLAGLSFLFALGNHLLITTILGGVLFLISSLGLSDILFGAYTGGYVGFLFSFPFLKLFDFWASLIIFSALLLASFLIMLNVSLKPKRKEKAEREKAEEKIFAPMPAVPSLSLPPAKIEEKKIEENDEETSILSLIPKNIFRKSYKPQKLELAKEYATPPLDLLEDDKGTPSSGDIKANANIIKRTLQNFGIDVEMSEVNVGPSVTQYTLKPAEGVKLARITALHNDLALALAAHPLRIEAPIPSKSLVGIEVPNRSIALVGLRSLLGMDEFKNGMPLTFALGRDVSGRAVFADIAKMPHLLVAGATGSGKSITMHTLIVSLLYKNSPEFVRFLMIDPKRVELSVYKNLPHLLAPVITDAKKAIMSLRWAVREMERRYEKLSEVGARDIVSYNTEMIKEKAHDEILPNLIIIIDELADLMASYPREMEASIVRLAQMSRAVGIHLVVSTQRPSVEVITGLIKANITSRIALQVASGVDSRTILDMSGAEKLLGNGDMLFLAGDTSKPRRIQAAFISEKEVKKVAAYVAESAGEFLAEGARLPDGHGEIDFELKLPLANGAGGDLGENEDMDDELYEEAKRLIVDAQKASASYLQRRLRVGYARAARLLDMLEAQGVIGPGEGAKPREVLIKKSAESIAIGKTLEPEDFGDDEEKSDTPYTNFDF